MGFNTALIVLNDGLDTLESDPDAGKKIASLVKRSWALRRGETESQSIGNHSNVVACLGSRHADEMQIIAIGGNRIQYLGYGGGYRATPEDMLRNLADQLGFRLVRKPERRTRSVLSDV